jgi:hypothetical protein
MIEESEALIFYYNSPHVFIYPALAIALTVLAFNFIGDGLREYLDPKQESDNACTGLTRIFPLSESSLVENSAARYRSS